MPASKKAPYGAVTYADDGLQDDGVKRYPLDTEEHVRAAASYFGMEKNRKKYTAEQQKTIDAKIVAAKKKFKIGDDADKGAPITVEIEAKVDDSMIVAIKAALAETKGEITALLSTQSASVQKALDTHAAAVDAKLEEKVAEATTKAAESAEQVSALKASVSAMVGDARKPAAPGGLPRLEPDGSNKGAPIVTNGEPALPAIRVTDEATGPGGAIRRLLAAQRI